MGALQQISKARRALEAAKDLDDVLQIRDEAKAVETYVKASRQSLELQNQAAEIKVRAERKAGDLIGKMKKAKPGPKKDASHDGKQSRLDEIGVSTSQASRLESMARVDDETFEELANASKATEEQREITSKSIQDAARKRHVSQNSVENEWYTPPEYIEAARDVLEVIDLDPASCRTAQKNVKADRFYTNEDDGLQQTWRGNVWLNPPYEKGLVDAFIEKLVGSLGDGDDAVSSAVVLVNNATETQWFQRALEFASAVCLPSGRIKFLNSQGEQKNTPLQGQAFLYFGEYTTDFANAFGKFGAVMEVLQ